MTRFKPIWRCWSCGRKMPTGEYLDCWKCDGWLQKEIEAASQRRVEAALKNAYREHAEGIRQAFCFAPQVTTFTAEEIARPASPKTLEDAIMVRLDQVLR